MRFGFLSAGVAALLAFSVSLSSAQTLVDPVDFYWGGGAGLSRNLDWCAPGLTTCEDKAFAPKAFVGLAVTPFFRIEAGYSRLGEFDFRGTSSGGEHPTRMDIKDTGTVAVVARIPTRLATEWMGLGGLSFFAKGGYFYSNADLWFDRVGSDVSCSPVQPCVEVNESGIFYGGGIEFEFWSRRDKEQNYETSLSRAGSDREPTSEDYQAALMLLALPFVLSKSFSIRLEYERFPWEDNIYQRHGYTFPFPDYDIDVYSLSFILRY